MSADGLRNVGGLGAPGLAFTFPGNGLDARCARQGHSPGTLRRVPRRQSNLSAPRFLERRRCTMHLIISLQPSNHDNPTVVRIVYEPVVH